jgi:hypothetical protein
MEGWSLEAFAWMPELLRLTRLVETAPTSSKTPSSSVSRSRTKMSQAVPLLSTSATRFLAEERKAT